MIYFIMLSVLVYLSLLDKPRLRDVYILSSFFVLLVFLGARWETGTDWESYIEYFQELDNYRNFEIGYVLANQLVRQFSDNYTVFLFVNGALALAPIAWFIRKESRGSIALSLTLFYSYYFIITYFGASRRIIAIGLCVLAAMQLMEKRHRLAFLLILAGSCFHYSAIICFIYYPLARYRPSLRNLFHFAIFLGVTAGLIFVSLPFLLKVGIFFDIFIRVGEYLIGDTLVEGYDRATLSVLSIAKRLLVIIFLIYSLAKNKNRVGHRDIFYSNCYLFSFAIYLVSEFLLGDIFKTFTIYFSIFEIALIPNLIRLHEPRLRFFLYVLFIPYVILQTYSASFGNPFVELYIPYHLAPDLRWIVK
jgi:transmembrane protein EpsG